MNKNAKITPYLFFLGLVLAVFYGIYRSSVNSLLQVESECNVGIKKCTFIKNGLAFSIEFMHKPVVEEELFIQFGLPSGWIVEQTWIEGINMYMGQTPVLFEKPAEKIDNKETIVWEGVTFLGSCNVSQMRWRLNTVVRNKKTNMQYKLPASFSSYQN